MITLIDPLRPQACGSCGSKPVISAPYIQKSRCSKHPRWQSKNGLYVPQNAQFSDPEDVIIQSGGFSEETLKVGGGFGFSNPPRVSIRMRGGVPPPPPPSCNCPHNDEPGVPGPDPGSANPLWVTLHGVNVCPPNDTYDPTDCNCCGQCINDFPRPIYNIPSPSFWESGSTWCCTDCTFNGEPGCDAYIYDANTGTGGIYWNWACYSSGTWHLICFTDSPGVGVFCAQTLIDYGTNFVTFSNGMGSTVDDCYNCGDAEVVDFCGVSGARQFAISMAYGGTATVSW